MQVQERIEQEERTWDKSRFRRLSYQQLDNLRSASVSQHSEIGDYKQKLIVLRERIGIQRNLYMGMKGLSAKWEHMRNSHVLTLSRMYDDLAAEITRVQDRQVFIDDLMLELHELAQEARELTE